MSLSRVVPKLLPVCPGRDSRFTLKRNYTEGGEWWVHYTSPGGDIPADQAHPGLVERILKIKKQLVGTEGGSFSINEHFQVIARMSGPHNSNLESVHAVDVAGGTVFIYRNVITFQGGVLDPTVATTEGSPWKGPLCGATYTIGVPGKRDNISGNYEDVRIKDTEERLSLHASGFSSYPPPSGSLADFLAALRRVLLGGGRFRVNEHRRAFTSDSPYAFIGIAPQYPGWFRPISAYP
jgi:hypothetical protein